MKLKSKIISSAVVAALGSIAGTAQAVNIGDDGQGQVLLYPYYTVQTKGTTTVTKSDTYITVVNSDSVNGKALKVRVIEGKNSQEVLDFNLYLSPNDVWVATLTRDSNGNGMLITDDSSCTAPAISASGVSFVNYAYYNDDAKDATLARAKEGYLEIIQMSDISPTANPLTFADALHDINGLPGNCTRLRARWTGAPTTQVFGEVLAAPTGGISGGGSIINPLEGTEINYDAVALDYFSTASLHAEPGSIQPNLGSVDTNSVVFLGSGMMISDWGVQIPTSLPVSGVLMRNQVVNEYATMAAPTGLGTDWVVTFPTKRDHISQATAANKLPFTSTLASGGACEQVGLTAYDREEGITQSGLAFSPPPPGAAADTICWEANVLSFVNGTTESNVLGGVTTRKTLSVPYSKGWLRMNFGQLNATATAPIHYRTVGAGLSTLIDNTGATIAPAAGAGARYIGLPVIGFAAFSIVNTTSLANYGGNYSHRYTRSIGY